MSKQSYKHPRTYTTESFKERLKGLYGDRFGLDKVEYNGTYEPIVLVCPVHGDFAIRACRAARGDAVCKLCSNEEKRLNSRIPFETIAKKIVETCPNYQVNVNQSYTNTKGKIEIICDKHGMFKMSPNCFFNGQRCPKCSKESMKEKLSHDIEWLKKRCMEIHGDKYCLDKFCYVNNKTKGIVTCKTHGEFLICPTKLIDAMEGCPKCKTSKLELKLANILRDKGIEYIHQHKPKWLGLQSLDFYLPKYNLAIECQGIQHFKPTRFGGITLEKAEQNLSYVQSLDERKRKLCKEHDLKLLYFTLHDNADDFVRSLVANS